MKVTRTSMLTGIERTMEIDITEEQLNRWDHGNGELIQKVMPDISDSDREFILTGIIEDEWEKAFEDGEHIDCGKLRLLH